MKKPLARKVIYGIVLTIGLLLLLNVLLIYKNSQEIDRHKLLQDQVSDMRLNTLEALRTLHLLDLGLRGYALSQRASLLAPFDSANSRKNRLLMNLKVALEKQNFPMGSFYTFRDSVETYYHFTNIMKAHIDRGDNTAFMRVFNEDHGNTLMATYRRFVTEVNDFESRIISKAQRDYQQALFRSYALQAILFLLCFPTLLYLAHYTNKRFDLSEKLLQSEAEKTLILSNQNEVLERSVAERTQELVALNEEITAQNEEIMSNNDQLLMQHEAITKQQKIVEEQNAALQKANVTIEKQNKLINEHNLALVQEVENQTIYLTRANNDLSERNTRLEQYGQVIAHNLRAPLSRVLGLANLIAQEKDLNEMKTIAVKVEESARDLDTIVKDLTAIIDIEKVNSSAFEDVNLDLVLDNVLQKLSPSIKNSRTVVLRELKEKVIISLSVYMESIFLNLIDNAMKFRSTERSPVIIVQSGMENNMFWVRVSDNGIGIDIEKHKNQLFMPYKRFHTTPNGKGLGLYIVKTQAETLGGKVTLKSRVNEGTSVTLKFGAGHG